MLIHGICGKPLKCTCGTNALNLGVTGPECRNCSPVFSDAFFHEAFDLERTRANDRVLGDLVPLLDGIAGRQGHRGSSSFDAPGALEAGVCDWDEDCDSR